MGARNEYIYPDSFYGFSFVSRASIPTFGQWYYFENTPFTIHVHLT